MNYWLKNIVLSSVKKVAGVSIRLLSKDEVSINLLILEKSKGKLNIVEKHSNITSYQELFKIIPKSLPVSVNVEGLGVLIKPAKFNKEGKPEGQIIGNPDKFIFYNYIKNEKGFISIIRKDLYEGITDELKQGGIQLFSVRANVFIIENLFGLIKFSGKFIANSYEFVMEGGEFLKISPCIEEKKEDFNVGGDILSSDFLLCYAECILYFACDYDNNKHSDFLLNEFIFKRLTEIAVYGILMLLLVSLLVNYIVNDNYKKEYNIVNTSFEKNKSLLHELKNKKVELEKKEKLIVKEGGAGAQYFAWYADRLASLMPQPIVLNKIEIQPILKKIQSDKIIQILDNVIEVNGEVEETRYLNIWIDALENEKWIKQVELDNYFLKELNKSGVFQLKIFLNEN